MVTSEAPLSIMKFRVIRPFMTTGNTNAPCSRVRGTLSASTERIPVPRSAAVRSTKSAAARWTGIGFLQSGGFGLALRYTRKRCLITAGTAVTQVA